MKNSEFYLLFAFCCVACLLVGVFVEPFNTRVEQNKMRTVAEVWANKASRLHGVPVHLIMAVIEAESSLNPTALSPKGAMGLMQLMPLTAKEMGVKDPYDPEQSIAGGTAYLAKMYKRFNKRWDLALAAYNAGPQRVVDYGGIPPFPETQLYVDKVLRRAGLTLN